MKTKILTLAAALGLAITQSASAASLSWTAAGNSTLGGTGTWDTTNPLWWDGASAVAWPASGTDNDAVFAGTAGNVTVDSAGIAVNDMAFTTTGYILTGSGNITLNGTTPTITVGSGLTATIGGNATTVLVGSAGLTKAGAGTLTLSGNAVNTFTGGVTVNAGTLAINLANLSSPANLISNANSLTLSGGTLSLTGKTGGNSTQTFASTSINSGNSRVSIVKNSTGFTTTAALGNITQSQIGGVLSIFASDNANPSTTLAIATAVGTTVNSGNYIGSWAVVGDSRTSAARWANVNASSQVVAISGTAASGNLSTVTSNSTVYTITGNNTLVANATAFALQDNDTANNSVTLGNFTITTNGLAAFRADATITRSFVSGGGNGTMVVGSSNELVAMGKNNLTVAVPIVNGTGGNSNVTYAGGGTFLLSANNTFSGQMTVNSGTVRLGTGGSINSSNGIKVNGGSFIQTNTSTAVTPTVTLQGGTVDGTGTINTVNVTDLATNVVVNGNGTTSALTINDLTFSGDATVNIRTAGAAGLTVTNALTTTPANGVVTLNVTSAPVWISGNTYNLIGYGSWSGSITDFAKGTIAGLGARQTAALGTTGASNGFITLGITGESITWTGAASGNWTTATVGAPYNWKTSVGGVDTEFIPLDDVVFDDTGITTAINISTANVSPNTTTFNNSSANYTVSSTGGFGIAAGTLTKSGTGTLTLTTNNTYTGATTINGGTLQVSGGSAITNTGLVTLADVAGATFQVVGNETIGSLSGGGATGGAVTIDAGQMLTLASGTQTYNGTVTGAGTLANAGATQTLAGALSQSGGLNANSGVLTLASSGNTYTGNTTIASGAGIVVTANNALGATGAGNETVIVGTGGGAVSGALGLSGNINYTAAEKVTGAGLSNTAANGVFAAVQRGIIQSVSGNNTFGGSLEINAAGITRIGVQNGAQLNISGNITGAPGAILFIRSGDTNGDFVTLSGTGSTLDQDVQVYSGINNIALSSGLRLGADNAIPTNVSVVCGSSATNGTTFDLAGYNQSLNGLGASTNNALKIINSDNTKTSTLTLNPTVDKVGSLTGVIKDGDTGGKVALVKTGSFSQTLYGANTYTGNTTVSAGTLLIAATASLGNSNVSVDGGTLGGGGTINGNVTVAGTATLQAGSTLADNVTFTLANNLTMAPGSIISMSLGSTATTHDVLARTGGTWSFDAAQSFSFLDNGAVAGTTYTGIITGLALDPGSTAGWSVANAGWTGTFSFNSGTNAIDFALTAIPEPKTWALIGLGLGFTLFRMGVRARRIKRLSGRID